MYADYIALTLWLCFFRGTVAVSENICHYNYNSECHKQYGIVETNASIHNVSLCVDNDFWRNVRFTIMLDESKSSDSGIMRVDLPFPKTECKYAIALLVNSSIDNVEDCRNHEFHKNDSIDEEVHTIEKTVCSQRDIGVSRKKEDNWNVASCEENLTLWYEYVYTGCYTLRFKLNDDTFLLGKNEFLETTHRKSEISEPKFKCSYNLASRKTDLSKELVTFTTGISVLTGSSGLLLRVALTSPEDRNKENACIWYSKQPVFLWSMSLYEQDSANHNCTVSTVSLPSNGSVREIECNFDLEAPINTGYCFFVRILDERCHKHTSWNPPLKDKVPCSWIQNCIQVDRAVMIVEESGVANQTYKHSIINYFMLPLFVTAIFVAFLVLSSVIVLYKMHTKHFFRGTISDKEYKDDEGSAVIELNGIRSSNEKLDSLEFSTIVILYVRGSENFMAMMSDFREILERHSGCDVRDWWAPEEWDNVARMGGYEWIAEMIRKDCRIVWIDTEKARCLFASQYKIDRRNGNNLYTRMKVNPKIIGDYRDTIFPAAVDLAKRSFKDLALQYRKHFVVRFEGFDRMDKIDDPFADLSPHARYLIPNHLNQLLSQLSVKKLQSQKELQTDKTRLREHLLQVP